MDRQKIPKGLRKYICRQKARIRREVLSLKEQEKKIAELFEKNKA